MAVGLSYCQREDRNNLLQLIILTPDTGQSCLSGDPGRVMLPAPHLHQEGQVKCEEGYVCVPARTQFNQDCPLSRDRDTVPDNRTIYIRADTQPKSALSLCRICLVLFCFLQKNISNFIFCCLGSLVRDMPPTQLLFRRINFYPICMCEVLPTQQTLLGYL